MRDWSAAGPGTLSGFCFAVSANAFRQSALALDPVHHIPAALVTVAIVQAMQSAGLTLRMALRDRHSLRAALGSWGVSLGAGLFGALASAGWFTALGPCRRPVRCAPWGWSKCHWRRWPVAGFSPNR